MENDNSKLELEDLAVLYAIGALDSEEAAVVEAALQNQPELAAKVEEMRSFDAKLTNTLVSSEKNDQTPAATQPATAAITAAEKTIERQKRFQLFRILGNVAVLAVVVLAGTLLLPKLTNKNQVAQENSNLYSNQNENSPSLDNQVQKAPNRRSVPGYRQTSHSSPIAISTTPKDDHSPSPKLENPLSEPRNLAFFENEILIKGQLPDLGNDEAENSLLECFNQENPENQKEIVSAVSEFFNLLKNPENAKAQDFQNISTALSKLKTEGDNKNLESFIKIIDKAAEIVQKKELSKSNQ